MNGQRLEIMVEQAEGALLRVLGTVERRGFRVRDVQTRQVNPTLWQMVLLVDGERPVEVLCRQLERLVDVHLAECAAG